MSEDVRKVLHCELNERCGNTFCRGTGCKNYEPRKGSYHDVQEPIRSGKLVTK